MNWRSIGALLLLVACGGEEAKLAPRKQQTQPPEPLVVPAAVDTRAPARVTAGQAIDVGCTLLDGAGAAIDPAGQRPRITVVPASSVELTSGKIVAVRAGEVAVSCTFPGLGLADPTPAQVAIAPGPAAHVLTELDHHAVTAGESVAARCSAVDAQGNPVDVDAGLLLSPSRERNTVDGLTAQLLTAGTFLAACEVVGAQVVPAPLDVRPGLPVRINATLVPMQQVYAREQPVHLEVDVRDSFGNEVQAAHVAFTAPGGEPLGDGWFRFSSDGEYVIEATVVSPTEGGEPLVARGFLRVDSAGPLISCVSPGDAAILDMTPGGEVTFLGSVADATGVAAVRVNGTPVALEADGTFAAAIPTRFGVNAVDVSAEDLSGARSSRICSFLVADRWAQGDLADAITMRLGQGAIDDGFRTPPMGSLADLLQAALGSAELASTVNTSLAASNPFKDSCDEEICLFGGCTCVMRSRVDFVKSSLPGPNTAALRQVAGGMSGAVRFEKPALQVRVRGHVAGIPYDTTGWITVSSIAMDLTFDLALDAGRLRMSVRPNSVKTTVGSVSTSFSGLDGAILNIVASLASGSLRGTLQSALTGFVTDAFDSLLDGVLGGIDFTELGSTLEVPRLDGGTLPLTFSVSASSVSATASRDLIGMATHFDAPPAHARPGDAVPLPPGPVALDPDVATPLAVGFHVGVLAQAIHALWRGGFLDAALDPAAGVSVELETGLPPAVSLQRDRVFLHLGAVRLKLGFAGLLEAPVDAWLASSLSLRVSLVDGAIAFDDVRVEELHLSIDDVDLADSARQVIAGTLADLLQEMVGGALQGALPSLPVPSFTLPAEVTTYGLPEGASLGLTSPSFEVRGNHLLLTGASGIE